MVNNILQNKVFFFNTSIIWPRIPHSDVKARVFAEKLNMRRPRARVTAVESRQWYLVFSSGKSDC